jgi:LuxR family maltose regulon positive regulatory protein
MIFDVLATEINSTHGLPDYRTTGLPALPGCETRRLSSRLSESRNRVKRILGDGPKSCTPKKGGAGECHESLICCELVAVRARWRHAGDGQIQRVIFCTAKILKIIPFWNQLMTSTASDNASEYPVLVLNTMPPRMPRYHLPRPRLSLKEERFRDYPIIVMQAPTGFGKTSLLGQWRRELLAHGGAVAWMTADDSGNARQFLHGLVLAVRTGCARPAFGKLLLESSLMTLGGLEGITAWLAEAAQTALDLILIVDDADRLSSANFSAFAYLLHNAPPNLRVMVSARAKVDVAVVDLMSYGQCLCLNAEDLRFRLDETMALAHNRLGTRIDDDMAGRLQELTEGWPLGLQMVMAAVEKSNDPRSVMTSVATDFGRRSEALVEGLLTNLTSSEADFLVRIAVADHVHPDLCRTLTGLADAPERLAHLMHDTPLFVAGDDGQWARLHNLARDTLRTHLAKLPQEEQVELHLRALYWMAEHGMIEEAARHAHAAGRREVAYDLAEQCLYDAVMQGRQEAVLRWLELLPEAEMNKRPRLRLAAAWALSLSERPAEADRLVHSLLENPDADPALRYECALIASGAAYYADNPDQCVALFAPWTATAPPTRDPRLLQMHANRLALTAILSGDPAQARRHVQTASTTQNGAGYRYGAHWGDFLIGLSYFWEGKILLGQDVLRHALENADLELGRRHPQACMNACLLAAAAYERNHLDEAAELLTNRLDVLERVGTPEAVLLAYRTVSRIAAAKGIEHRALDLLEMLHAVGAARHLPRLCVASLGEQVRIHAGRFRPETCRALALRIDQVVADSLPLHGELWRQGMQMMQDMAHAYTAFAKQDWHCALKNLEDAAPLADALKMGRWRVEIMALSAYAKECNGENGRPLILEALNLAQAFGLERIFVDTHPAVGEWVQRVANEDGTEPVLMPRTARPQPVSAQSAPRAVPSMMLTPKERIVLEHLARNLSNKEIAQAMEVGEETVKWHVKNLFAKLDAGTRRHVVRRAQLLGLLEGFD